MSEAKHTPGPWEVRAAGVQSQGGDAGTFVARVNAGLVARCMTNQGNLSSAECLIAAQANARLIAAAPELLAACKEARHWITSESRGEEDCLKQLDAAIDTAEGQL
jgi:hypothetical protein